MSVLPAGWTTTYRPELHVPLSCWSIDNSSRCSSHITASSDLPLTASIAPGAKTPDLSATSTYLGRLLGFGVSGLLRSWYLTSTPTTPRVPSPRLSTNAASNARRLLRYAGSNQPGECAKRTSVTLPGGASGHQV